MSSYGLASVTDKRLPLENQSSTSIATSGGNAHGHSWTRQTARDRERYPAPPVDADRLKAPRRPDRAGGLQIDGLPSASPARIRVQSHHVIVERLLGT